MIKPSEHKDLIDRLLKKHDLSHVTYNIVSDVDRWCIDNKHIPESDYYPFRQAKTFYNLDNDKAHILFLSEITENEISSGKGRMLMCFFEEVEKLDTDIKYFEHLILHEIACVILKNSEQEIRDKWAFNEMELSANQ